MAVKGATLSKNVITFQQYNGSSFKCNTLNVSTVVVSTTLSAGAISAKVYKTVFVPHSLGNAIITGVEPYVDGSTMCGITKCTSDIADININVSNYDSSSSPKITVGAVVHYVS